jgi:hypothetical protein
MVWMGKKGKRGKGREKKTEREERGGGRREEEGERTIVTVTLSHYKTITTSFHTYTYYTLLHYYPTPLNLPPYFFHP